MQIKRRLHAFNVQLSLPPIFLSPQTPFHEIQNNRRSGHTLHRPTLVVACRGWDLGHHGPVHRPHTTTPTNTDVVTPGNHIPTRSPVKYRKGTRSAPQADQRRPPHVRRLCCAIPHRASGRYRPHNPLVSRNQKLYCEVGDKPNYCPLPTRLRYCPQ